MNKFGLIISILFIILFVIIINFSTKLGQKNNQDIETIKEVKTEAIEISIYNYVKAIENQIIINSMDMDNTNDIINGTYEVSKLEELGVVVARLHPTDGWVKIENNEIIDYSLLIPYNDINYVANYKTKNTSEIKKDNNIK